MAHKIEELDVVAVRKMAGDGTARPNAWHGIEKSVFGDLTPEEFAKECGMDHKVVQLPVYVHGKTAKLDPKHKALVHSRTGEILDVVSDTYKVVQPREMVTMMGGVCREMGAKMDTGGTLRNGKVGFLSAELPLKYSIKGRNGEADNHTMFVLVSTGWIDGYATQVDINDIRAVCDNTTTASREMLVVEGQSGRYRQNHRTPFGLKQQGLALETIKSAEQAMTKFESGFQRMTSTNANREEQEALVLAMLQPELAAKAIERQVGNSTLLDTIVVAGTTQRAERGVMLLDSILNMDAELKAQRDRSVKVVMELLDQQPGAGMTYGSAAHAYNAVTYWTGHVRGRGEQTRQDSSLLGDSRLLKQKAWDLTLDLCVALEARA